RLMVLFEITLNNLRAEGEIDEKDFLDRADILCSLGQTVLISNYQEYYKLIHYFSNFTQRRMGLIMGVANLQELFKERYYRNLAGGILEAFGILFMRDLKIYLYPQLEEETKEVLNSKNCPIHYRHKPLYDYLVNNKRIIDLEDYDPNVLHIFSRKVLSMIKNREEGWEEMVPGYVDNIIKENRLFGYEPKSEEVESNNPN
ncbi:MAG: TonB-dependent receptor, partial [Luteibaculum sp.]